MTECKPMKSDGVYSYFIIIEVYLQMVCFKSTAFESCHSFM